MQRQREDYNYSTLERFLLDIIILFLLCPWRQRRVAGAVALPVSDLGRQAPRPASMACPMLLTPQQVLAHVLNWSTNIWLGVSVESAAWLERAGHLRETGAATKFLSLEPLLGPLTSLDLTGMDWVIAGGESGPRARPMEADWVREICDRCLCGQVPFFFKQWSGVFKKRSGRVLDGRTWDEMPLGASSTGIRLKN